MSIRVKMRGGFAARVATPSISTIVNRGNRSAEILNSQPVASVTDTATSSRVQIPFSYVPICIGQPTDVPREFHDFVPVRIDIQNNIIYFYYDGWHGIGSTAVLPVDNNVFTFASGDQIAFGSGDLIGFGIQPSTGGTYDGGVW